MTSLNLSQTPWAMLAAGSLCAAVLGYACAARPSDDCGANGTCPGDDGASPGDDGASPGDDGASPGDDGVADAGAVTDSMSASETGTLVDQGRGGAEDVVAENNATSDERRGSDGSADGAGDGAGGGDAGSAESPTCNPIQTPSQDACVIDERYGVFVSPKGNDLNLGTRAQPVKTLGHAMTIAKGSGQRVYACAGNYAESLAGGVSRDGTSVYGGLDCATWSYGAGNQVVVAPSQTGYALDVEGLMSGVTFEDVEFDAQDANPSNPGESSVAVF